MKPGSIKRFVKLLTFPTLKKRIVFSIAAGILACCILTAIVSYNAIYTMQQNKIKTAMSFDLVQQSTKLTQIYSNLLQITQQMTIEGNVGNYVENYYSTSEPYGRSVLSKAISTTIALITFSSPSVELVMYYEPDEKRSDFNNFPPRDNFRLDSMPNLARNASIAYQPPHLSQCRFSGDQVVSVTRAVTFSNGRSRVIYVEAKCDIAEDINTLSGKNMPYVLVLLDPDGNVKYSSDNKAFPIGQKQKLNLRGESGTMDGYMWNRKDCDYGYSIALLLPTASYNRELYTWKNNMFFILGIALFIMVFTAFMLLKLIYKPFRIFEYEMKALGEGHMDSIEYQSGVEEFDKLFEQFNAMKQQIQQLISAVEQKEKRRHQLEIEKLAYQINPHFLMNALNSAHWLAVIHEQHEIDKFISTLNFLLNYNLGKSQENATLRNEIKVLRTYLDLQQMRYDFQVEMSITEGEYLDSPIARFILQPIAENAICHGLDEHGILSINIATDEESSNIIIEIQDDGRGLSPETLAILQQPDTLEDPHMGCGIGLRYVRSMLESVYGDKARMEIANAPRQGTKVTLYLPYGQEKAA